MDLGSRQSTEDVPGSESACVTLSRLRLTTRPSRPTERATPRVTPDADGGLRVTVPCRRRLSSYDRYTIAGRVSITRRLCVWGQANPHLLLDFAVT